MRNVTKSTNAGPRGTPATRRQVISGSALAIGGMLIHCTAGAQPTDQGVSHSADSIHQEPVFAASRKRVYEALTTTAQFDKVIQLSGVMRTTAMASMKAPTEISLDRGGAFSLFGGLIVGRQIELLPDELIVQAWRAGDWDRGIYSIARFDLTALGAGTKILFDHTGFPKGQGKHLAAGWWANYWTPLQKYLA
jgi:activator of HSP90 ATPase